MTQQSNSQSPSEVVADKIMERLVENNLLTQELAKEIVAKVANGRMQSTDWKLVFEKALELHKRI